jgi:GT2 family glycosyltransferase
LHDLSFVIPLRVDSDDRVRNLRVALRYLDRFFPDSEVIVVESSPSPQTTEVCVGHPRVRFRFDENPGRFSKGTVANIGILEATRRFVAVYDADVLLDPRAIELATRVMRTGLVRAILPFNSVFADVDGDLASAIASTLDVGVVGRVKNARRAPPLSGLHVRVVKGGIILADRDVLRLEGGFNKKMVSYDWQDVEVIHRLTKLGYRVFQLRRFSCVHLDHDRGPDSMPNEYSAANKAEFSRVIAMSRRALERYVEDELDIAGPAAASARASLRQRQRLVNALTLQPIVHPANQLAVAVQAHGPRELVGRALAGVRARLPRR